MKIQYASDLHLEFHENSHWLKENPLIPVGDVLILVGDIGYLGDENYSRHPFWDWCADNFKQTVVVPGNHELYKSFDINELHEEWSMNIRSNVRACYNSVVALSDEIGLIASTLWAHIHPYDEYQTERGVTDFHRIRNGKFRLSAQRFNAEHERCREFIARSVAASKARHIIVATHHVPSFELMSDEFKGSPINGAFTSELGKLMPNSRIDYWIYGHSHPYNEDDDHYYRQWTMPNDITKYKSVQDVNRGMLPWLYAESPNGKDYIIIHAGASSYEFAKKLKEFKRKHSLE